MNIGRKPWTLVAGVTLMWFLQAHAARAQDPECAGQSAGTPCPDNDGLACFVDQCDGAGNCVHTDIFAEGAGCIDEWNNNVENDESAAQCTDPICATNAPFTNGCGRPKPAGTSCGDLDNDSCTLNQCNGAGSCEPAGFAEGAGCIDEWNNHPNPCTEPICSLNAPFPDGCGKPLPAGTPCPDDDNPCTLDECDGAGHCNVPVAAGTRCPDDDGLACFVDQCDGAGNCLHTDVFEEGAGCIDEWNNSIDDLVGAAECTEPLCSLMAPFANGCGRPRPAGTPCTDLDGSICTVAQCDGKGRCVDPGSSAGAFLLCPDDGDPCTAEVCDAANGCHSQADCDDNNLCTVDERDCDPAVGCRYIPVLCLDDGNPCNREFCDPAQGCISTAVDCDDNDRCTMEDRLCDPVGGCQHLPLTCQDDNDPCTAEVCGPAVGCVSAPLDCPGACCPDTGPCVESVVRAECEANGGTFLGEGSTCASTPAPCCFDFDEPGCLIAEDCCKFLDGATCEGGTCCLPTFVNGDRPRGCLDDADCCKGTCHFGAISSWCCFDLNETGCTADEDCCGFTQGEACQDSRCCILPSKTNGPTACADDADCCAGICVFGAASSRCCIPLQGTGCMSTDDCCDWFDGATCEGGTCDLFGACTTCCECRQQTEADCAAAGGEFQGVGISCTSLNFTPDTTPPQIECPVSITLARGDVLCTPDVPDWLESATANDDCGDAHVRHDASDCGFAYGTTAAVTFTAEDDCGNAATCISDITIGPAPRVDISKKGSLLAFSKVDLRWNAAGMLTQDTFIALTNDYPHEVYVQMYFVNGDAALDPIFSSGPSPVLIAEGEPGWNWVDCQVLLTPDQPVYWSASSGSPLGCQPFTILDPDLGNGPGRPAPDANDGSRSLRGFVIAFAVNEAGSEIQWNHLSGKATIVDYANTTAWEYDAFAFQSGCRAQGDEPPDCTLFDEQGVCCTAEVIPGALGTDGFQYDYAFDMLLLDFFGVGSQALSGPSAGATVDTDLTLHILSADLRQETDGPVTTKAHFDIWNMNERKLSNTRRCLTCWDQTLLSQYNAPNSFLRENLQSDKGKARIDGKHADECEENCFRDEQGEPLDLEQLIELLGDLFNPVDFACSEDAALLGLAAKYLAFSGPAGQRAVAGSNLVGMGTERALIQYDVVGPPGTLRMESYNRIQGDAPRGASRLHPPARKSGADR